MALPEDLSQHLGLAANAPVLMVERSSFHIDGRVVELSQAYCCTEKFVYAIDIT